MSSPAFTDASVAAFIATVSDSLPGTPDLQVTVTRAATRRRRLVQDIPSTTVSYVVQYGYFGSGAAAAYDSLVAQLSGAVQTGAFTRSLRKNAALYGAPPLKYASSSTPPVYSPYTVLNPPTSKTAAVASTSGNDPTGMIAGVVIAVIALIILLCIAYRYRNGGKSSASSKVAAARASSGDASSDEHVDGPDPNYHDPELARVYSSDEERNSRGRAISNASAVSNTSGRTIAVRSMTSVSNPNEGFKGSNPMSTHQPAPPISLAGTMRPSENPASRVPALPGRKPRRSIKYSHYGSDNGLASSQASHRSSLHSLTSYFNPFEEPVALGAGRVGMMSLASRDSAEDHDVGQYVGGNYDDSRSEISESVACDDGTIFNSVAVQTIAFPVPFRGDPLCQVNVQIGWNCLYADGEYLVEVNANPNNLTSFVLQGGGSLKSLTVQCEEVDSSFMRHVPVSDLKASVWNQIPFEATFCLGRYEDQMLLMVTDARHNLQKDASKPPLWRWVAKELASDALIPSGASLLVVLKEGSGRQPTSSHLGGYIRENWPVVNIW